MKITDSKNISSVNKKKKSSKSGNASGVSFDSMVEAATSVEANASVDAVKNVNPDQSGSSSYIPNTAEELGNYMLDKLEELEQDILSGNSSSAVERLKEALETEAIDRDQLSPKLLEILNEIEVRVSIEVAKMESANES